MFRAALKLLLFPWRTLTWPLAAGLRFRQRRRRKWLELRLEGELIEQAEAPSLKERLIARLSGRSQPPQVSLQQLRRLTEALLTDTHTPGVLIQLGALEGGWASVQAVRACLLRLRAAGLPLVIHARPNLGNRELLLAATATRLLMMPSGGFNATGAASFGLFWRDPLAQLGIEVEAISAGRFKSAPEQLTRRGRSADDEVQVRALIQGLDEALIQALIDGRGLDRAEAEAVLDAAPMTAEQALALGVCDGLCYDAQLEAQLPNPEETAGAKDAAPKGDAPGGAEVADAASTSVDTPEAAEVPAGAAPEAPGAQQASTSVDAAEADAAPAGDAPEAPGGAEVADTASTSVDPPEAAEAPAAAAPEATDASSSSVDTSKAAAAPAEAPNWPAPGMGPHLRSRAAGRGLVLRQEGPLETLPGRLVGASAYLRRERPAPLLPPRGAQVGIVRVHGPIVDTPLGGLSRGPAAVTEEVVSALRAAGEDDKIGAVVLHVDSRGGSVTASEAIYGAVRRLDADKPVVACFGDYAASGGYFVGCGARAIVASELSVTGSVGVFAMLPRWAGLRRRLRIGHDAIHQRKNAAIYEPWGPLSPAARAQLQAQVDAMYQTFLRRVADARALDPATVDAVAQGRVWLGRAALQAKLVDHLDDLAGAVRLAAQLAPERRFRPEPRWMDPEPSPARPATPAPEQALLTASLSWIGGPARAPSLELLSLAAQPGPQLLAYAPLSTR